MNRELAHLKAAVVDLVSGIQRIHQRRRDLDDEAAALYRTARANGLQKSLAKEVILGLRGESATDDEIIWSRYKSLARITDADEAAADHVSALDRILDGPAL